MQPLQNFSSSEVVLAAAVTALALPPPTCAVVPTWLGAGGPDGLSTVPELELEMWATSGGTVSVTSAKLFAGHLHSLTFAPLTVTGVAAVAGSLDLSTKTTHCNAVVAAALAGASPTVPGDGITIAFVQSAGAPSAGALTQSGSAWTFTFKGGVTTDANFEAAVAATTGADALVVKTPGTGANVLQTTVDEFSATALAGAADAYLVHVSHGLLTGDGPFQLTDVGGTLPPELSTGVDYWAVKVTADHFGVATSLQNALAGVVVEFSTTGSGTISATPDASCFRVYWTDHGLLGDAGDGAITLSSTTPQAYWTRVPHSPRAVAYAMTATFTGTVSVSLFPRQDRS